MNNLCVLLSVLLFFFVVCLLLSCICRRYHFIVDNKSFLRHKMAVKCTHIHTCTHRNRHTHSRHQCMCLRHFRCAFCYFMLHLFCILYSLLCVLYSTIALLPFTNRCSIFYAILFLSLFKLCMQILRKHNLKNSMKLSTMI